MSLENFLLSDAGLNLTLNLWTIAMVVYAVASMADRAGRRRPPPPPPAAT